MQLCLGLVRQCDHPCCGWNAARLATPIAACRASCETQGIHHVPAYASANASAHVSAHVSTHRSVEKIPYCNAHPGKHRAKAFLSHVFCERRSAGNAGHRCLTCRRHTVAAHQQHAMTRDACTDHVICTAIHRASRVRRCGLSGTSPTAGQRCRIVARSPHVRSDCIRHRQPPFFHQPRESRGPIRCWFLVLQLSRRWFSQSKRRRPIPSHA